MTTLRRIRSPGDANFRWQRKGSGFFFAVVQFLKCAFSQRKRLPTPTREWLPLRLLTDLCHCAAAVIGVFGLAQALQADVFELKDGRKMSGSASDYDQGKAFLVQIDEGIQVVLLKTEIKRHDKLTSAHQMYRDKVDELPPTIEAHAAMAAWCAKNGLKHHEQAHYQRMLDFEPDHAVARAALGYKRDKTNEWARVVDIMTEEQGKVRVKGAYRFPELVVIEEANDKFDVASKKRGIEIRRWQQEALSQSPRAAESLAKLQQINDEISIPALSELLLSNKESDRRFKSMYVQIFRQFRQTATAKTLVEVSMRESDANIRDACYDALLEFGKPIAVASYKAYLLNDDPNLIERAADGLAVMNDPSAVLPLINALTTTHVRKINPGPGYNVGTTNGSGGISMGGGPKNVEVKNNNARVLGTLSQLTGVSFQFDKSAWLAWYASKYGAPAADLRRDP